MNLVDWKRVSEQPGLSEAFIIEHQDKLDWRLVICYATLSEPFIEEYIDKLKTDEDWRNLLDYQNPSFAFVKKHIKRINMYWIKHCWEQKISQKQLQELQDLKQKIS